MRNLIVLLLIISWTSSPAQKKISKQLDSITSAEKAEAFLKQFRGRDNKILTFNEEKHKTRLAKEVLKMGNGSTKVIRNEIENIHYKVIDKTKIPYYRVNYIMFDGKSLSLKEINRLRPLIMQEIKNGTPVEQLAKRFSMDQNAQRGGDSGWITHGDMLPEFEEQVMNEHYGLNDIFTVDVQSNQWYYVVVKTHDRKDITEVKVLKVVETKK